MKTKQLNILIILSLLFALSVKAVKAQNLPLILGDSVEVYGPFQQVIVAGEVLKVRTKLLRHWGTTCQYDVEITNTGTKLVSARTGLLMNNTNNLNINTSVNLNLKPNYYVIYKLEIRECLKRREKNPIISCMTCPPVLGFYQASSKK